MRRAALLLTFFLPGVALAQGAKDYRAAGEELGRGLLFVAADRGAGAARKAAGPLLPRELRDRFKAVAEAPQAADLKALGDDVELKAEMLQDLLSAHSEVPAAFGAFAQDAGSRLDRELTWLEGRVARLRTASRELVTKAEGKVVASRKGARAQTEGRALLRLAAQASLLRRHLADAKDPLERYDLAGRLFDRRADRLARALLGLLLRVAESAKPELQALGAKRVSKAGKDALRRLNKALKTFGASIDAAQKAIRLLRDEELRRVVQGDRSPTLDEVVPYVKAYRKQFNEPPALRATPLVDVYEDRRTARLALWIPGQERWILGPERVDPMSAVIDALLDSGDPALQRSSLNTLALARAYRVYEERSKKPFAEGWKDTEKRIAFAAKRVTELRARAAKLGAGEALERFLARRGADLPQEPAEAIEGGLRIAVLRTVVGRSGAEAHQQLRAMERLASSLSKVKFEVLELTAKGPPAGTPVELSWRAPEDAAWAVPGPTRGTVGEAIRGVLFALQGSDLPQVSVDAYAWVGGEAFGASVSFGKDPQPRSLLLTKGDPGLVVRAAGDALRVTQLPSASPPLELRQIGPKGVERPLAPAPGGGYLTRTARDPGGRYQIVGKSGGEVAARTELDRKALPGVVLLPKEPWVLKRGDTVKAKLRGREPRRFEVRGEEGQLVKARRGKALTWVAKVPPGRYAVTADGDLPGAAFGVGSPARLTLLRSPLDPVGVASLHGGQGLFLRLDAWPSILLEEVLEVRWKIGERKAVTRPLAGLFEGAGLLPLDVAPDAKPGELPLQAQVVTARGVRTLGGKLKVGSPATQVEVQLQNQRGRPIRALATGEEAVLRPARALSGWALVGPRGARALVPRFDGQVPIRISAAEPPGSYEVWGSGEGEGGKPLFARLSLRVYEVTPLEVKAPSATEVGSQASLEAPPPEGFVAPYEIRVGSGAWQPGTTVTVTVRAENDLRIALRDAKGRQARARVRFSGERKVSAPKKGPRFGLAANVDEKRIFAAPYALLQSYIRNENLPDNLVLLEQGPLTAAGARDRLFKTIPYDGPAEGRQAAYRSERFWELLQRSSLERFEEVEEKRGTPYTVQDSPSPNDEYTLKDLVAQHLDAKGGWSYQLIKVRVRADGAQPAELTPDPKVKARLLRLGISKQGGAVERVAVSGPLADLDLALALPKTLDLSRTERLGFSLTSRRRPLVERPYPASWEQLAAKALVCPELSVEVTAGDQRLSALTRSVGQQLAGSDVSLSFEHQATERDAGFHGNPRVAERHVLRLWPLGSEPQTRDVRFEPLQPGSLKNEPQEMTIKVVAYQRRALPTSAWPANKAKPDPLSFGGLPFFLQTQDVPEAKVEVLITYLRAAPGARTPPPKPGKALGELTEGRTLERSPSLEKALAQAEKARKAGERVKAESKARRALQKDPLDAKAWALLAELSLAQGKGAEAVARARWSVALEASARAWVVLGEAAVADADMDAGAEALRQLSKLEVPSDLRARVDELKSLLE